MMGEKQVREECKEPVFYTIDCNREELMRLIDGIKGKKKTYDNRFNCNRNTMLLRGEQRSDRQPKEGNMALAKGECSIQGLPPKAF